jgi:hypothetical protein
MKVEMAERTGGSRRLKHRVLAGRVPELASNALLAKGVQSLLSPKRIAEALDRGASTQSPRAPRIAHVRRRAYFPLPVVETPAAALAPSINFRSWVCGMWAVVCCCERTYCLSFQLQALWGNRNF